MTKVESLIEELKNMEDAKLDEVNASLADDETPETLLSRDVKDLNGLKADVKLIIHNPATGERLAFGPGVARLCEGIKKYSSIQRAAKEMNMAYSKAWKIVGEAEDALGLQLVVRGATRKGCSLSEVGEALLAGYQEIDEDISKYALFRFQSKFHDEE